MKHFWNTHLSEIETPSYVVNEDYITKMLAQADDIREQTNCKILYTLKPFVNRELMKKMAGHLDGFSVSSLFEAKFAQDVLNVTDHQQSEQTRKNRIHCCAPGLSIDMFDALAETCGYISINSLSQLHRKAQNHRKDVNIGLRINPEKSYVTDRRYDPCRADSRLGIPLKQLEEAFHRSPNLFANINGLHFHTNCDSSTFDPLLETVDHILENIKFLAPQIQWINLGGGYLFRDQTNYQPLFQALARIRNSYPWEVFLEPGAAFVRESTFLISSVVDIVEKDGFSISVLDTSVNHMPEVFEYQESPSIVNVDAKGKHQYQLAGCSCLSGDIFGVYAFQEPLKVGSKVVFKDMGAYTLVKAQMFNGINLPCIYLWSNEQGLRLKKRFTYEDFLSRMGENV